MADDLEYLDQTVTVTISLDDHEVSNDDLIKATPSTSFDIEKPVASNYLINVDDDILIAHIPSTIQRVLQLRLNPPVLGTLRNWEAISSSMGMSLDEILMLRAGTNPMEGILHEFSNIPLNTLLTSIRDINRLDVLISLRPHLRNIKDHLVKSQPIINQQISLPTSSRQLTLPNLPNKFILVTHYEPPDQPNNNEQSMTTTTDSAIGLSNDVQQPLANRSPQKRFKYLWNNLKKWGQSDGISVIDIDKCINEANAYESLCQHFALARQIVLVSTKEYRDQVCSNAPAADTKLDFKRQLHELMQTEYTKNGRMNERFRVIVFSAEDKQFLPMGWPSNTFVYTFPENHLEIAKRIFYETRE